MDSTLVLFILYCLIGYYNFFKNKDNLGLTLICLIFFSIHIMFYNQFISRYDPLVDGNNLFLFYGVESVINLILSIIIYLMYKDRVTTNLMVCLMVWLSLFRCIVSSIDPSSTLMYESYPTLILTLNILLLCSLTSKADGGNAVGHTKNTYNRRSTVRSTENYLHNLNKLCEQNKNKRKGLNHV